ncbi:MAG: tryptophan-rich sensory protein [Clostridia bacterium]|nr:tryptophan-rich sensory protein [Clostridia bacterium]
MKIYLKRLLLQLALPLAVGGIATLLTRNGMTYFADAVEKPPLTPPPWVFGVVWTVIYLLMGVASYLVAEAKAPLQQKQHAQTAYAVQLVLNFLWPLVFFNLKAYFASFLLLLALWIAVAVTVLLFGKISKPAAALLVPYLLWLSLAGYLNLGVWQLN